MATLLLSGTQLQPTVPKAPLNKAFLIALGAVYLLAMHFFMPNPGGAGLALSFNPTTWIAVSITIAIGWYQIALNQSLRYSKLTVVFFVSCCILSAPLLYGNAYLAGAIGRLTGLWAGLALFICLQQFYLSNKHKQRLLWYILLAVLIQASFGLYQYLLLSPNNWFGYNTLANRPYGIFQQPNVMASFMATGLIVSGYLLARQPKKYDTKLLEIGLLYLTPLLTLPLLVVLASRTGWLSAVLGTMMILPYLYRFAPRRRLVYWISASLSGVLLGFVAMYSQSTSDMVTSKADLDSPRRYTFPQTVDMLIEKPFTGYGYGNFETEYLLYTARQHQLNPNYPAGLPAMDHPHNELLFWGVEGGLLPLLGIAIAAGFVLLKIRTAKKGTRLAMLALLVPIVVHSQLEYPFYHSAIHWISFIVLLYWIDQRVTRYRSFSFSHLSGSLLRILSLVLPIITSLYMLTSLHSNYVLTQFEKSNPPNPDILHKVTNPLVWRDRFDWNIYSTYLNLGLHQQRTDYIQPYIDWSLSIIQHKPRPAFYRNLILAYQGLGDESRAAQIRSEAEFLFPTLDFTPPSSSFPSSDTTIVPASSE
ncbi:PglL family O-oligosaccharyltransferase [Vibrio metschnikovii]|uniref:PglL family O-oligosaccharyltransferase n=1 Tax=Vibrio metschnikovii TaxID=28172 RepID=UPI001C302E71|nr:PglL family O-oligosaccharyltransferase [Vibrio metschnikovii]